MALVSDFGPKGHSLSDHEINRYFGFGCVFYQSVSYPKNAKTIKSSYKTLDSDYKKHMKSINCPTEHIVFDITQTDFIGNINTKGTPANCDFDLNGDMLSKIFELNFKERSLNSRYIPSLLQKSIDRSELVLSIHVRRGDVLEPNIRENRLVSLSLHLELVKQFLLAKKRFESTLGGSRSKTTKVFFVSEGATNNRSISDYDFVTKQLISVDVVSWLSPFCNEDSSCNAHVFSDSESSSALHSFTALCRSDVLFTSASGLSHLAAILCKPKLTVAIPFWCPYNNNIKVVQVPDEMVQFFNRRNRSEYFYDGRHVH